MKKAILIDGNSLLHRAFYALPPTMKTHDGRFTNAIYGFLNMLFTLTSSYKPDYLAVAFDVKKYTFRNDIYCEYKAGRKSTPPELAAQFPLIRQVLEDLGVSFIEKEGYEGDDILGTLSKKGGEESILCYVVTGDRDSLQLVGENCRVLMTKKGVSELEEFDSAHLKEVYSLSPSQIIDLKSLMGDSSDNIPGVAGVGEKTALKLLAQYPTLEELYDNLENLPKNKLYEKLVNDRENAFMSKDLATIRQNVPVETAFSDIAFCGFEDDRLKKVLLDLEFTSMLKKFGLSAEKKPKRDVLLHEIANEAALSELTKEAYSSKKLAFYVESEKFFLSTGGEEYVVELSTDLFGGGLSLEGVLICLKAVLEDESVFKYLHGAKNIYHLLSSCDILLKGLKHDVEIGAYVLDPTRKKLSLDDLKNEYDIDGYAGAIFEIADNQRKKIDELKLDFIFDKIEMPLIDVLYDMEKTGFKIDRARLKSLSEKYQQRIEAITKEVYDLAGESFNIGSPKQLSEILFVKLGLPAKKRTKSGFSTDAEVLEGLVDMHPIIPLILEYRSLTKLKGTYIDGFLNVTSDSNSIVHTTFNQTVTATGRISSAEPNLQNIPQRSELSREIREVFIPSKEDNLIVSADYSQIELRILAHIAGDEHMTDAFINGEDIHTRTASEVFDVSKEEVTKLMRSSAKAVNFGIVYGISEFGLAKQLGIPRYKAGEYIKKYLAEFSGVNNYMHEIVESAKEDGYVRTLFGRIRYIDELKSSNFNTRSFGERAAMNTPIQGTAADIIKLAMISVYNKIKEQGLKAKLILQVHDELVIDTPPEEVEAVRSVLINEMTNAFTLSVPLDVDVCVDKTF